MQYERWTLWSEDIVMGEVAVARYLHKYQFIDPNLEKWRVVSRGGNTESGGVPPFDGPGRAGKDWKNDVTEKQKPDKDY